MGTSKELLCNPPRFWQKRGIEQGMCNDGYCVYSFGSRENGGVYHGPQVITRQKVPWNPDQQLPLLHSEPLAQAQQSHPAKPAALTFNKHTMGLTMLIIFTMYLFAVFLGHRLLKPPRDLGWEQSVKRKMVFQSINWLQQSPQILWYYSTVKSHCSSTVSE